MSKLYYFKHFVLLATIAILLSSCGKEETNELASLNRPVVLSNIAITKASATDPELLQNPDDNYNPGKILVSSQFNQKHPFNLYLPKIGNQSPPIGCVNAALIGLIHYYRQILKPKGTRFQKKLNNSYDLIPFELLSGIAQLPAQVNSFSDWWEQDLIARLALYLTEINGTKLDLNGSLSSILWENVARHFGINLNSSINFSPTTIDTNVIKMIETEIDAKRPLLLHLQGGIQHLTLIDGYKYNDDGTFLVHINFEWDGQSNDWYDLSSPITKEVLGNDGQKITKTATYYILDSVIICPESGCYAPEATDRHQGETIIGNFADNNDVDIYHVANIEGTLSLRFTGYQPGIFVSIINSLGQKVFERQIESYIHNINGLAKGNYQIRIARSTMKDVNNSGSSFPPTPTFPMNYTLSYSISGTGLGPNLPTDLFWSHFPENMSSTPQKEVVSSPLIFFNGINLVKTFDITFIAGEDLGTLTISSDNRLKFLPNGQSGVAKIKVEPIGHDGEIIAGSTRVWEVILKENMHTGPIGTTQIVAIEDLNYGTSYVINREVLVQGTCSIKGGPWDSTLLAPTKIIQNSGVEYGFGLKSGSFEAESDMAETVKLVISVPESPAISSQQIDQKYYFAIITCPELNTTAMDLDQYL